jgi:hypothetical protein
MQNREYAKEELGDQQFPEQRGKVGSRINLNEKDSVEEVSCHT